MDAPSMVSNTTTAETKKGEGRRKSVPAQLRLGHDLSKRLLEPGHLFLGANRYADVGGHHGPDAADVDVIVLRHGGNDFAAGALYVDHELVALRRDEAVALAVHPGEHIFADVADDLAALGNQGLHLEAGVGTDHTGDRQCARAVAADFLQQCRTADGGTGA